MISRRNFALLAGSSLLTGAGLAQDKYPSQLVRIIDGYVAGGGTDALARYLASKAGPALGTSVVVENRPGASGQIAMASVAKAKPDGHTLMVIPNELWSVQPLLYKQLPYDVEKDFAPVAAIADLPIVLTASSRVTAKNVGELVAQARQSPNKVTYGSAGPGTIHHLSGELFNNIAGVQMLHVPYRGTAAAVTDLLSAQIDVVMSPITAVLPHIKAGKLRALGVAGARRVNALPDVPTLEEAGLKGAVSGLWVLLVGPAGMPPEVSATWMAQARSVFSTEDARNLFGSQGVEPLSLSQAELRQRIADDTRRWSRLIQAARISVT